MTEEDVQLLNNYKAEQQKIVASIQRTEAMLLILCSTIDAMAVRSKWYLDRGYGHIRDGMLALTAAAASNALSDEKTLELLKKRQQQGVNDAKRTNDSGNQESN